MALQLQWGLEQSSKSTIEITTDLVQALTTDNVQVLAILACERFGNTLAISADTRRKIEHSVVPTPQPAVISFLQSKVGYAANDCATQLGKSTAGVQFLALAVALITTMGLFQSSTVVHEMLESTAKDKALLPTTRQVRDLLESIEPRCYRSGIADDALGWEVYLDKTVRWQPNSPDFVVPQCAEQGWAMFLPENDGIHALVDALRQLCRIGNDDITKVSVETTYCAPWTMAFVKWSLGYPPNVILADDTSILKQAGADVTIVMDHVLSSPSVPCNFRVTVHSSISGPVDLVDTVASFDPNLTGSVSLKSYGILLQRHYRFNSGLASRAFHQVIPYALHQVSRDMRHVAYKFGDEMALPIVGDWVQLQAHLFPDDTVLSDMLCHLFDYEQELRSLDEGLRIADLPLMALHLKDVKETCDCRECQPSSGALRRSCKIIKTLANFNMLVADILCLSLFERPEQLRVSTFTLCRDRDHKQKFLEAISTILHRSRPQSCTLKSLLSWTLELVRHKTDDIEAESWVMSSYKGQVVWPTLFESLAYTKSGGLSLSWLPGVVRHKGDVFQRATGPKRTQKFFDRYLSEHLQAQEVIKPCNLFPDMDMSWSVSQIEGCLEVSVGIRDSGKTYPAVQQQPWSALINIMRGLILEDCAHDPDSPLERFDAACTFTGPMGPDDPTSSEAHKQVVRGRNAADNQESNINVVAVDGHDKLRFAALSARGGFPEAWVLRRKACLACCIDTCRRVGVSTILL